MKCWRFFWYFFGFVLPRSVIGWKISATFSTNHKQKSACASSSDRFNVCIICRHLDVLVLRHYIENHSTNVSVLYQSLSCEPQTHFGSSLLCLLFFGGREATTGNASAVRRLTSHLPWSILGSLGSKFVMCRARENWGEKRAEDSFPDTASACYVRELKQRRRNETVT